MLTVAMRSSETTTSEDKPRRATTAWLDHGTWSVLWRVFPDVLNAKSLEYAAIGTLAASLHGVGHASLVADFVVSSSVSVGSASSSTHNPGTSQS